MEDIGQIIFEIMLFITDKIIPKKVKEKVSTFSKPVKIFFRGMRIVLAFAMALAITLIIYGLFMVLLEFVKKFI